MLAMDQVVEVAVHTHQPTLVTALAQIQIMVVPTIPHTKATHKRATIKVLHKTTIKLPPLTRQLKEELAIMAELQITA